MSSHVRPIVIEGHQQDEGRVPEELQGQHMSSAVDPNFSLEQGKLRCMYILFNIIVKSCLLIMDVDVLHNTYKNLDDELVALLYPSLLSLLPCSIFDFRCAMLSSLDIGRCRVVGPTQHVGPPFYSSGIGNALLDVLY
jgi:hypothetical protein